MTKKHSTKKALIASVLSLVLCFSMLVGTTFAWFTDSVTSANNIITSGNLDVELYYQVEGQTDWTKVTETTNVFKENALWEPGHTEVVKLKVVNEGSLALKYNLGVNVASEVGSVNVNGDPFLLSEFIKFAVIDGANTYTRDEAIAAAEAAGATALKTAYNSGVTALLADEEAIVTMVVYMPTTVGNDANAAKGAATPTINLGLNLLATQYTAESDSFNNQYDKDAAWDGKVPTEMPDTLVVDKATYTVHVKDAAAFAYLSNLSAKWAELYTNGEGTDYGNYMVENGGKGFEYYYSGEWTVSLDADINLFNYPIEPVDIVFGQSTGATAFDGNGHVISNINTTTGLFANNTRASFSNLTLENVKATNGALIGSANASISNVTVKNADISGVDYVGGLVGYIYGDVTGCKVIDSSVAASGKEAGGLIGYIASSSGAGEVRANEVRNVSVYADNRAAGLVAQANVGVKVYNNTIDAVTVLATGISSYQPGAVVSNALATANVYDNTATNCEVGYYVFGLKVTPTAYNRGVVTVSDKDGLLNLSKLAENWVALFSNGEGSAYGNYMTQNGGAGEAYYSYVNHGWTVVLTADVDFGGASIDPIDLGKFGGFDGNGHLISNAKIVTDASTQNEAGLFVANACAMKNLNLDNIQVTGSNVGNSTAGILCGSCSSAIDNITITNSSVTGGKYTGGVVGYGYCDVTNCALTNVSVKGGYKLGGVIGYICASGENTGEVTGNTLTGCTVDGIGGGVFAGGKDKYVIGQVVGNYNCNGTCNNNTITGMTSSVTDAIGEIEAGKTVTQ